MNVENVVVKHHWGRCCILDVPKSLMIVGLYIIIFHISIQFDKVLKKQRNYHVVRTKTILTSLE